MYPKMDSESKLHAVIQAQETELSGGETMLEAVNTLCPDNTCQ